MSGFEVIGVVLGTLPILFLAVDESKKGIARGVLFFRKRRYVEKLALALLTHKQHLIEILKSILIGSGCNDLVGLDHDPVGYLKDESIADQVLDYLGEETFAACSGLIQQCHETVKKVAMKIAGLVPTIQDPSDDLIRIIEENQDMKRTQLDLISRFKLMFGDRELKEITKELDETINSLSGLIRQVSSNQQTLGLQTSKRAINIAKSLRRAHESASNLYSGIFHAWRGKCHEGHETRLFLEHRIPESRKSVNASLVFPLIFSTSPSEKKRIWHEAVVKVLSHEDGGLDTENTGAPNMVTFTITGTESPRPEITLVDNICDAISPACHRDFFIQKGKIGMMMAGGSKLATCTLSGKRSLKELFSIHLIGQRGATIPIKFRILLALQLASNLLQLLQTYWLPNAWSHETVFFPVMTAAHQGSNLDIDHERPFISTPFTQYTAQLQPQPKPEPRVALLELGILLLEIWHEETLETHFSLGKPPTEHFERLMLAEKWLYNTRNPPPGLYEKAASHCIKGMIGGKWRHECWDDNDFWNAVCEDIIQPLYTAFKRWGLSN